MSDLFNLAVLQHQSSPGDVDANLNRLSNASAIAASKHAQLLVTPEASLCGYNLSLETNRSVAQVADGELRQSICELCKEHKLAIAYGFVEKEDDTYYNTGQLIDMHGDVLQRYRKNHLWGAMDNHLFKAGDRLQKPVNVDGWQVAILICYDVEFPEYPRIHALAGADLIVVPTALAGEWHTVADKVIPVRAYENQLYVAYANYCGDEHDCTYAGRSCICGPDASDLARAEQEDTLLIATLDKTQISAIRTEIPYHQDRLPEFYRSLST